MKTWAQICKHFTSIFTPMFENTKTFFLNYGRALDNLAGRKTVRAGRSALRNMPSWYTGIIMLVSIGFADTDREVSSWAQVGSCVPPQLSETVDARKLSSTKTQIDRRFRATGRDQTQARACRPRPDVGGREHAHVVLRRAATIIVAMSRRNRTCGTRSYSACPAISAILSIAASPSFPPTVFIFLCLFRFLFRSLHLSHYIYIHLCIYLSRSIAFALSSGSFCLAMSVSFSSSSSSFSLSSVSASSTVFGGFWLTMLTSLCSICSRMHGRWCLCLARARVQV